MFEAPGDRLREYIRTHKPAPFIGVYDVFSATLASRHYEGIFVSGFGFAASMYGLPDIGFVAWSDIVAFTQRLRIMLPRAQILVDVDDVYGDAAIARHVVAQLEQAGASGIVMEDQLRPRSCGHYGEKAIAPLESYLAKLTAVLETRRSMFVVARTDASEPGEIVRRARAFQQAGADAVLVDAINDFDMLRRLRDELDVPLVFNQIRGGRSPRASLGELAAIGVSLVIYSTPCLFAAHEAIERTMLGLAADGGRLPAVDAAEIDVTRCMRLLEDNVRRRDQT